MEPTSELAPPVVVVMVVHEPGPWFDEVLQGLARQDYVNLRNLFLVVGEPGSTPDRIRDAVPGAFVRGVDGNPGFGAVADEVLQLVEGDNGFFCFLHDDVALEPETVRVLVEELYRSNAGVVGPKLLDWDAPHVLQHVGFGCDHFGEIDPIVEHGEIDQEQHDAVRDVFAVPSACLMVRADLFRALDGFDRAISFHGEDLELCWRVHRSGARVVVVPAARARHRERLVERRPDLAHETLRSRHRIRAVATLTGLRRLPLVSVQLVLLTLAELVVGSVTGGLRRGVAGVRAVVGLLPRTPEVVLRRRAMRDSRHVPDREVARLQLRGSARLVAYLRSREVRPAVATLDQRSLRARAGASGTLAWVAIVAALALGARQLLADGVPGIGQFLPFDPSPRQALRLAVSGWSGHGAGASVAAPTGLALIAVASVVTGFHMGLLHTLSIVGLMLVGPLGIWRLSAAFDSTRARIVSLVVYAGLPLAAASISVGRWSALACYAALPWLVDGTRRIAGLAATRSGDDRDPVVDVPRWRQVRDGAFTALVVAVTTAFAPSFVLVAPIVVLLLAIGTLLAGGRWVAWVRMLLGGLAACAVGIALDLPWLGTYLGRGGWAAITGPRVMPGTGRTVLQLAGFHVGNLHGSFLAVAGLLPVVAAPLLAKGWRAAWAARAGALVVGFGWLAVLDRDGRFAVRLPESAVLLAPVAVGVAIAAGCVVAAFDLDVLGSSFGWRQPLGLFSWLAVIVCVAPGVFALTTGRFETPTTSVGALLGQLPSHPTDGDYRILWIGDQRLLPVAGQPYHAGVAFALTDDRSLTVTDVWPARPTAADAAVRAALDAIANGSTARAGRLLAPLAVRYVVIPAVDGAVSTDTRPLPMPAGLVDALGDQLDVGLVYSPPNVVIFENKAWLPTRSMLTAEGALASKSAEASVVAQADLAGAIPVMPRADQITPGTAALPVGTLHLAVPFDRGWHLDVGGTSIAPRPAFGTTVAFDVPAGGAATLRYDTGLGRHVQLVIQLIGWIVVALLALGALRPPLAPLAAGSRRPLLVLGSAPEDPLLATSATAGDAPDDDGQDDDDQDDDDQDDDGQDDDEPDDDEPGAAVDRADPDDGEAAVGPPVGDGLSDVWGDAEGPS